VKILKESSEHRTGISWKNFLLLLLLLFSFIEPYPVLHPVYLFSCKVDVQLSQQSLGRHPDGPSHLDSVRFPLFATFASRLSCLHGLLILAHFMTS